MSSPASSVKIEGQFEEGFDRASFCSVLKKNTFRANISSTAMFGILSTRVVIRALRVWWLAVYTTVQRAPVFDQVYRQYNWGS